MLVTTIPEVRILPLSRASLVPAHFLYPSLGGLGRVGNIMGGLGSVSIIVYVVLAIVVGALVLANNKNLEQQTRPFSHPTFLLP